MWQTGLIAPLSKAIPKTRRTEWSTKLRDEERQMARGGGLNNGLEIRMERDIHLNRPAVFIFCLGITETAISNVRRTKAYCILSSAGRVEHECHSQPRLPPNRVL
jgi:hypothetical protein